MANLDLNHLCLLHSPEPEPDAETIRARLDKLNLMHARVLAGCKSLYAIDSLKASRDPSVHRERFAGASSPDVGLILTQENLSVEFQVQVQQPGVGVFQPGTIWIPIPSAFLKRDLPIELHVMRFDVGSEISASNLEAINVGIAEQFPHGRGGALLSLEPKYWDDPALPAGFAQGRFTALASLGLVGRASQPDVLMVAVGCVATTM